MYTIINSVEFKRSTAKKNNFEKEEDDETRNEQEFRDL